MSTRRLLQNRILALFVWLAMPLFQQQALEAQERPSSRIVIDSSIAADRQLQSLRNAIKNTSAKSLAADLLKARANHKGKLVPVASNHWQRVGYVLDTMVGRLSNQDLNQYLGMIEPVATVQLEQAAEYADQILLRNLVNEGYHSLAAQKAMHPLAENEWHRGNIDLARHYWTQLVPLNSESKTNLPIRRVVKSHSQIEGILEKLVYCSLARGDHLKGQKQWDALCRRYPEQFEESSFKRMMSAFPKSVDDQNAPGEFRFVRDMEFNSKSPITASCVSLIQSPTPNDPSYRLFVLNDDAVLGINVDSGKALWPVGNEQNDKLIFRRSTENGPDDQSRPLSLLSPNRKKLLATYGDRIFCLDVDMGEGKLIWSYPESCPECNKTEFRISSQPLYNNGHVYFTVRSGRQLLQTTLVCLDSETGEMRWKRTIGVRLAESFVARSTVDSLSTGIGLIFLVTSDGLMSAVDSNSGEIEWIYDLSKFESDRQTNHGGWELYYSTGLLCARYPNRTEIVAHDAASGTPLWASTLPIAMESIVGSTDGTLICQGICLIGVDAETGVLNWRSPLCPAILASRIHHRRIEILTSDERIFLSSTTGEVVDSSSTGAKLPNKPTIVSNPVRFATSVGDQSIRVFSIDRIQNGPTKQTSMAY